jgi:propionyl-CoA synthetase
MKAHEMFLNSIENKEQFWAEQADQIHWFKKPQTILSQGENNYPVWFADGELNACYLAIDKHIEDGYGDQVAYIYDSPVTDTKQKITFNELKENVSKFAGGLQSLGLKKGDNAIIYMPMIPQAAYAMLACARLGITHSVVFGGFAPHELAIRIDDCNPKAIITASAGVEVKKRIPYLPFVKEAYEMAAHKPEHIVVFDRQLWGNKVDWENEPQLTNFQELLEKSEPADCVPVKSKFLKDIAASNTCFNTFFAVMAKADIFTLLSSINSEKLFKRGINVLYRFLISVRGFIA